MPAWQTADLGAEPDYRSKTGAAEIRLLPGFDRGELAYATVPPRAISEAGVLHGLDELFYVMAGDGLAHCTLPAGQLSPPVRHRSVDEIWYVLEGEGELWRSAEGEEEVAEMRPDRCLTIPVATTFQFRTTGEEPLRFIIGTFPP